MKNLKPIASYAEVIEIVKDGKPFFYQGPMDFRATRVTAKIVKKGIRISPLHGNSFDAFTADESHLDRFRAE